MQVLFFMGPVAQPSKDFDNVVGSLLTPPSDQEVAWAVSKAMRGEFGYSRLDQPIEFADAFVCDSPKELKKLYWKVGHANRPEELTARSFVHPWQDAEGRWHAVQQMDPLEAQAMAQ